MGWLKIYKSDNLIWVEEEGSTITRYFHDMDFEIDSSFVYLRMFYKQFPKEYRVAFADLQDGDGNIPLTIPALETYLGTLSKPKIDVSVQDSTAPIIIVPFSKLVVETTLTASPSLDAYVINVTDATDFAVGQLLTIYDADSNRVMFSKVLAINTLAITLDSPIDFEFPIGSFVSVATTNMNLNGAVTPQVFGVRNPTNEDIPLGVDITRVIFAMLCGSAPDLSKFGNIAGGITRGVVLRKTGNGFRRNIFNAKTNAELKSIMYDFDIQAASGNQQDGATGRLTFGGAEKLGAVIRLKAFEDLQLVIQDDLTSLTEFTMNAEGSEETI